MDTYAKPLPRISLLAQPFWEGATRSEIRIQKCRACGHMEHPPRPVCPDCWSDELDWVTCGQDGTIYSYTVCHWATMPEFKGETPYVIAIVELPGGVRLTTGIVDCPLERIAVGMTVRAVFEKVTDTVTLIKFRPA